MKKEISVTARFLIGVRWDGRETKLSTKETGSRLDNPAVLHRKKDAMTSSRGSSLAIA